MRRPPAHISLIALGTALLVFVGTASAARAPVLTSISHTNRHPTASFSAPGADAATIYFASKPDRAPDGGFLRENIKESDPLTADEIQRGTWSYERRLDPRMYYVILRADDFGCSQNPNCTDGYSNLLTLKIPNPATRYSASVTVFHHIRQAMLTLRARPLGERRPYKVCWRLKSKRKRCISGVVAGKSWNSGTEDTMKVSLRGMAYWTTFTWYVKARRVARTTARTWAA